MKQERIVLFLLAAVQFIYIVDFMIIMPLFKKLDSAFDITAQQFTMLVSIYSVAAAASSFAGAFFIDRFDRRSALLVSFAGFSLATIACGLSNSYWMLLTARALTGAFGGLLSGLVLSIIGDVVPNERRGAAMGILTAAFSLAAILGVPLGLQLGYWAGWNIPFLVLAVLGFGLVVLAWFVIPSMRGHIVEGSKRESPVQILGNVVHSANQLRALAFYSLLVFGQFLIIPFIAPYMEINVAFDGDQITMVYFLGGLFTFFSGPLVGRLSDRFGRAKVFILMAVGSVLPIVLLTNLGAGNVVFAYMVTVLTFIFFSGRMIPATTMMTSAVDPAHRGSFMSISTSVREMTMGLAAFVAGLIVLEDKEAGIFLNYEITGYIAVVLTVVALPISRMLKVMDDKKPVG